MTMRESRLFLNGEYCGKALQDEIISRMRA